MKKLLPALIFPFVLMGCRTATTTASLEVAVPAETKETVIIETPDVNAPILTLRAQVISIRPIRRYKGYWIARVKGEDGRIYRVQINSTYLTYGLFGIGTSVVIHGYTPRGNLIIPSEIIGGNRILYRHRFRRGFRRGPRSW